MAFSMIVFVGDCEASRLGGSKVGCARMQLDSSRRSNNRSQIFKTDIQQTISSPNVYSEGLEKSREALARRVNSLIRRKVNFL
jgi:hypothetical protein